jgi:hypothetical protein
MTSRQEGAGALSCSTHIVCGVAAGALSSSCVNYSDRPLRVEVVAQKDLGGDHQIFLPKHLLQTAAGILFLEGNEDFRQSMCAGYEFSKSHACFTY